MEFGIVSRITQGVFRYQAWPTVAKDEKGVLYVGASSHRLGHVCPFGKNYLCKSYDDGKTWTAPMVINDTNLDDRDAGITAWGDGQLTLTWFNLYPKFYEQKFSYGSTDHPLSLGMLEHWKTLPEAELLPGSYLRHSTDGGNTWSEASRAPVTSPHGPIRRKDGSLFYLGKEFFSGDATLVPDEIYAFESRDNGKTWQKLCHVPLPEGFEANVIHEPHAVELPDGTILGGLRITSDAIPQRNGVFTTFSTDGGKTFSAPQLLDLCGTPPHFLLHSSGAVVLTYGCRKAPCGQRARISHDGGKTWSEERVISPTAPDWDTGYPSSVELSDGSILTVYYQKYEQDTYNSILYTKWSI